MSKQFALFSLFLNDNFFYLKKKLIGFTFLPKLKTNYVLNAITNYKKNTIINFSLTFIFFFEEQLNDE